MLANRELIDPHRDWSGLPCLLAALASLGLAAYSWLAGERQVLFLLAVFLVAVLTAALPLVCVEHDGHNPIGRLDHRPASPQELALGAGLGA